MKNDKEKKKETKFKEGTVNGMKFDSKHDDDDDFELENRKEKVSTKTLIKIAILCVVALVVFFVFYLVIKNSLSFNGVYYDTPSEDEVIEVVVDPESEEQEQVNLKLNGELVIEIEKGTKWEDPGYIATSSTDGDITDYVKVSGKVNVDKVGTYELVYELDYKVIAPKLTRLVKVVGKEDKETDSENKTPQPTTPNKPSVQPAKPTSISLSLNGSATVYLVTGSNYSDEGAKAVDNLGNNVSSRITKTGSVNTNEAGTYKITYSINNYNGQVLTVVRNVVVQAMYIDVSSLTLGNRAEITVRTDVENFSHVVLPDSTKTYQQKFTHTVYANDTYVFEVFNTNGVSKKINITINNISPYKPSPSPTPSSTDITCEIKRNAKNEIEITMSKNSNVDHNVDHYEYNGQTFDYKLTPKPNKCSGSVTVNVFYTNGTDEAIPCTCP